MPSRYIWVSQNINDTLEVLKPQAWRKGVSQLYGRVGPIAREFRVSSPVCFNQKNLPFVDALVE